jgi:transcription antitermination factor NusA-like protein
MKICKVCLQSDMLCGACAKKLEDGLIRKVDIDLSRAVHKIGKDSGYDIDFLDTIDGGTRLFVIVESRYAGRFIGPGGRTIKKISELVGKQIKLVEKATGTDKHIIEKMIDAPVIGINRIYDGKESYKVRVEQRYRRNVEPVADVIGKLLNKKVSFIFE